MGESDFVVDTRIHKCIRPMHPFDSWGSYSRFLVERPSKYDMPDDEDWKGPGHYLWWEYHSGDTWNRIYYCPICGEKLD